MGYKIVYAAEKQKHPMGVKWRFPLMTGLFFMLFILFARFMFAEELRMLFAHFLPASQMEELIENLRQGFPTVEAIAAFCEEYFYER